MVAAVDAFRVDGRSALVTGAARGIGRAVALALAAAGADVAVLDLPEMRAAGDAVRDEVVALGRRARFYPLDVAEIAQIEPLVARVVDDFGALDILVNNAGFSDQRPALELDEREWDRVVAVDLTATFFFARASARHMIARGGGRIVNVGSSHGIVATGKGPAYKASKAAVHGLTRELAVEWIGDGIVVNAVAPGPVQTPRMEQNDARHGRTPEAVRADIARRVPLGRRLRPEEVAAAVVFLAAPASSGIVGHTLVIDGGQTIW